MRKTSFIPAAAVSIFLGVAVLLTACGGGGTSGTASIYLTGNDGINGYELWSTDGSSAQMVADINTTSGGSSWPSYLTTYDGNLYFEAHDGTNGVELWAYDGSSAYMVTDIYTGASGSAPSYLTTYGGNLYFKADDGTNGAELWTYDGSSAYMVTDIYTGTGGSYPSSLATYGGKTSTPTTTPMGASCGPTTAPRPIWSPTSTPGPVDRTLHTSRPTAATCISERTTAPMGTSCGPTTAPRHIWSPTSTPGLVGRIRRISRPTTARLQRQRRHQWGRAVDLRRLLGLYGHRHLHRDKWIGPFIPHDLQRQPVLRSTRRHPWGRAVGLQRLLGLYGHRHQHRVHRVVAVGDSVLSLPVFRGKRQADIRGQQRDRPLPGVRPRRVHRGDAGGKSDQHNG